MRVAIICPYSLSRPGGVQGQVVGLAGALHSAGHEAVVLAPADGPVDVVGDGQVFRCTVADLLGAHRPLAMLVGGEVADHREEPGAQRAG